MNIVIKILNTVIKILLISFGIVSCSSSPELTNPSKASIDQQESNLRKLYIGQPFNDVSNIIQMQSYHYFEVLEDETHHIYFNYKNFDTMLSLGVYFVNGKLASILSNEDSVTLFSCRTMFKTNQKHWLTHGMKPYSEWILSRNSLNQNFNYRENKPSRTPKSDAQQTVEGVATLVAYSPFIIVGSPFILYHWAAGDLDADKQKAKNKLDKRELATSLPLGVTYDDVINSLGHPNRNDTINDTLALSYFDLHHTFGLNNNDVVTWKETISMHELYNRQIQVGGALYGDNNCNELDALWTKSAVHEPAKN